MLISRVVIPSFLALVSSAVFAKNVDVTSPDGDIVVHVSDNSDQIAYWVEYRGKPVINHSRMGLRYNHSDVFLRPLSIDSVSTNSVNARWEQPWGERRVVVDNHNELVLTLDDENGKDTQHQIRFRVFNDGVGFRYENRQDSSQPIEITGELTEFAIADASKGKALWIPSRGWNRYEYLYNETPITDIDRAHTPVTMTLDSGVNISIHEAALVDFSAMSLNQKRPGTFTSDLAPRSDGLRVKTQGGFTTPWRTIQIAPDGPGLLNSSLILNLNEPNKLGDVDWVEPGKYVGIWWGMHLGTETWGSGEKHGATTENTKRYIDFAAKYGFDGVLVEGWNLGWDGSWFHNGDVFSFTQSYPDFDIKAITDYAQSKGVRLIGHHETSGSVSNYENQMDAAYQLYADHGVAQIKTGYVADGGGIKRIDDEGHIRHEWHDSQFTVNHYLHSVKTAAKYKLSINTHEPIKDTGLRRTYPNWLAREGARGQEFNAWGSPPNSPEHTVMLTYTRMLSGPMDFTPGIFNLAYQGLDAENRVQTTLAKQLALYVVLYSPIQMAADLPEHYEANLAPFQFIQDVPTDWEESIAIAGDVGDYAVFARKDRQSEAWYVGGITDEHARTVDISLDFLTKGKTYTAQIYQDGKQANWQTNPYDIEIVEKPVKAGEKLTLKMATSGGVAIRLVPNQ